MLLSTDGLPGPVTVKRFGKPAIASPSAERGPCAHFSRSEHPPRPRRSIACSAPGHRIEAGSEHDRVEREFLVADAQPPLSLISSIGCSRIETRRTFGRLKVSK